MALLRPPDGYYEFGGALRRRRMGLVRVSDVRCRAGHAVLVLPPVGAPTPSAHRCIWRDPTHAARCPALVYTVPVAGSALVLAIDVTAAEVAEWRTRASEEDAMLDWIGVPATRGGTGWLRARLAELGR